MSRRLNDAVATGNRLRAQRCTTRGHEDRPGEWLVDRKNGQGMRWVCTECRDKEA